MEMESSSWVGGDFAVFAFDLFSKGFRVHSHVLGLRLEAHAVTRVFARLKWK
jgi:hypothetical protein